VFIVINGWLKVLNSTI